MGEETERERERVLVGSCSQGTSRSWRTKLQPPPRTSTTSFLLPSASVLLALSARRSSLVWSAARTRVPRDAFRAPYLVIRVIYVALIAPRRTITADRVARLSRPVPGDTVLPRRFVEPEPPRVPASSN